MFDLSGKISFVLGVLYGNVAVNKKKKGTFGFKTVANDF